MDRKLLIGSILMAVLMVFTFTPLVKADPIQVGDKIVVMDDFGSTAGGIFGIWSDKPANGGVELFETFCIELDEYVSLGSYYLVGSISTEAVLGGVNTNSNDPLDPMSAYLYYNFRMGTLANFDRTLLSDVDTLQLAFWMIEQEKPYAANKYVTLAQNAINSGQWSGLGLVRVLNLNNLDGSVAQSMLTLVPEPLSLILLGLGLIGIAGIRRKF